MGSISAVRRLAVCVLTCCGVLAAGPVAAGDAKAGGEIIARAVEAMGGPALIDRILTITVATTAERMTPNGLLKARSRSFVEFPASFRQEVDMNGSTIAMASSPSGAFLIAPNQVQPLADTQRHNLEVTALRNPLVLLKGRRNSLFSVDADGEGKVGSTAVDFVNVYVGNEQMRIAVDKATGRIVQQEFETRGGVPERAGRMVVSYSDFRRIPYGITVAHVSTGRFEGERAFENVIESMRINEKLDQTLFNPEDGQSTVVAPRGKR